MSSNLNGRLLSIRATGTIGNAFTYSSFRSCAYVRKYATPTQTDTTAAIQARDYMSIAARAWSVYFNTPTARTAWALTDNYINNPHTSYNAFTREAIKLLRLRPAGSFVQSAALSVDVFSLALVDIRTGLSATETGLFEIWTRIAAGPWELLSKSALTIGRISIDLHEELKFDSYIKVMKDGLDRSGALKLSRY